MFLGDGTPAGRPCHAAFFLRASSRRPDAAGLGMIAVIVNPISGGSSNAALVEAICARLRAAGERVELLETSRRGDARRFAGELDGDTRIVLAVGGDGTVNEVVDGLLKRPIPLLIVPRGTENLLGRVLGVRADADFVARAVRAGRVLPYDVGVANGRRFLCVSGVGFDGQVIVHLERARRGHIHHASYFWPILRTFLTWRWPPLRVEVDGRVVFEGRGLAFVGNIWRYAIGLRILRDAKPDDGLLDVCCYACASRTRLLVHSARTLLARHVGTPGVTYVRGRQVRITAPDALPIEIDGESHGVTPIDYSILPGAAQLVAPAEVDLTQ